MVPTFGDFERSGAAPPSVDAYGLPVEAFGVEPPDGFFEVLGRILAVSAQIEYLQDRLEHLPSTETERVRKVEQFLARCADGRDARNAVVHSRWSFDAHTDPDVIIGIRYKKRKNASGQVFSVAMTDVEGSGLGHELIEHTMVTLRRLLKRDISTMTIGQMAYTEIQLRWAQTQIDMEPPPHAEPIQ